MSRQLSASIILDDEFLSIRAKLLEVAASLDRLDRAVSGAAADDPRLADLRTAMERLLHGDGDRAEQIQLIFSRPYEKDWRAEFGLDE
jgi:hypothetical protein